MTDSVPNIVDAGIQALINNAKRLGLTWNLRPATVANVSDVEGASTVMAVYDGDTLEIAMVSIIGAPLPSGIRVMVMQVPTGGNFIIGLMGEAWYPAAFDTNWSNTGGAFGDVGFRRNLLGHLELTGVATFSSVTTAPSTIFTLPAGYIPDRTIRLVVTNQPGANAIAPLARGLEIDATGIVRVTFFTGTINPGPISFEGLSFALVTGL